MQFVVKDYSRALIGRSLDPYLNPPLVTMQSKTLSPVVDQAVGRLEKDLFIYPGSHQ